jgi:hypothetical protein
MGASFTEEEGLTHYSEEWRASVQCDNSLLPRVVELQTNANSIIP